jgi:hypothetical protein
VKTEIIKQGLNWLIVSSVEDSLIQETKEVLKGVYDFNFAPFTTASGEHTVQNYLTNPEWCKDPLHHEPRGWDSLQEKFKTHTQRELVNYGLMQWESMKVHSAWSVAGDQGSYQTIHQHGLGHICTVTYLDVPEEDPQSRNGAIYFVLHSEPFNEFSQPVMRYLNVKPQAGMSIIFPSWILHGVYPQGPGLRRTINIDFKRS